MQHVEPNDGFAPRHRVELGASLQQAPRVNCGEGTWKGFQDERGKSKKALRFEVEGIVLRWNEGRGGERKSWVKLELVTLQSS